MINTFGYKIKFVKKKDLAELELFEKSVLSINQQVNDMVRYLESDFVLDEKMCHQITVDIEGLHKFVDIYVNNKFSLPHTGINIYECIDTIRKTFAAMLDLCKDMSDINKCKNKVDEDPSIIDDVDKFNTDYWNTINRGNVVMMRYINTMIMNLSRINLIIEGDLIKIKLGVDIIYDWKKRKRRMLKNKDLVTEFSVKFKVVQPDDLKYLKKEEYIKNGNYKQS